MGCETQVREHLQEARRSLEGSRDIEAAALHIMFAQDVLSNSSGLLRAGNDWEAARELYRGDGWDLIQELELEDDSSGVDYDDLLCIYRAPEERQADADFIKCLRPRS